MGIKCVEARGEKFQWPVQLIAKNEQIGRRAMRLALMMLQKKFDPMYLNSLDLQNVDFWSSLWLG